MVIETSRFENAAIIQWGAVLCASLGAALWDLKSRRIPNVITLPLFAAGLVQAAMFSGWEGLGSSVAGAILLALPYAVLFVFAGGGAGDAKMMAGIGAWLGLKSGVTALLFVSIFGIMVALLAAANKKKFLAAVDNIRGIIFSVFVFAGTRGRVNTVKEIACGIEGQKLTVPYGPAIFMGVVSAAVYTWMF